MPKHAQSALENTLMYISNYIRQKNVDFKYVTATAAKSRAKEAILIFLSWTLIGFMFYSLFIADSTEMTTSSKPQKTTTFNDIVGL